jgi:ribosome-binding factor A
MPTKRQTQVAETIAHAAAEYFARESNGTSLITVTRADISPDLKNVIVFLSVLPESAEEQALHFAKRSRSDFRDYVKEKSRLKFLPNFDFEIDYGEKNRRRIDEVTRK